ncbi:hypothetical protein Nepgr_031736 [Nepenthes gracilis]|uniref:Uncharacterized protein n=1 Tax=Nepenthes gracilis TaxID=150966 RepID=A0AAD3Y5D6_NEPGR|nr:hypothetical protein Nepgr_031736 [Nepenthes gracilis]
MLSGGAVVHGFILGSFGIAVGDLLHSDAVALRCGIGLGPWHHLLMLVPSAGVSWPCCCYVWTQLDLLVHLAADCPWLEPMCMLLATVIGFSFVGGFGIRPL